MRKPRKAHAVRKGRDRRKPESPPANGKGDSAENDSGIAKFDATMPPRANESVESIANTEQNLPPVFKETE